MMGNILLLCFLATALGEFVHPGDAIYPDHRYRRQVGHTRDDHAPPQHRNFLQNIRRRHKPILRNEIPILSKRHPVLRLRLVPVIKRARLDVGRARRPVLRGDFYSDKSGRGHHWMIREKPSKRDSFTITTERTIEGTNKGDKDAEALVDQKNEDNYSPKKEANEKNYEATEKNADADEKNTEAAENNDLTQPENEKEIPELGLNLLPSPQFDYNLKVPDQINEPQDQEQGNSTLLGGGLEYNDPQFLSQGYKAFEGEDLYNLSQDQNQLLNVPESQSYKAAQGQQNNYNGPPNQALGPMTPRSLSQNQDYPYQAINQGYNIPSGLNQDFKAKTGSYNTLQSGGIGYNPPHTVQKQGYNTGVGQDYNPPKGPENAPEGLGSAPVGPGYSQLEMGQQYNTIQGVNQNFIPGEGFVNPSSNTQLDLGQLNVSPPCQNIIGDQGQILNTCQNQIQNNCVNGQCYPNDGFEVKKKMFQLIRDTKLTIDRKVMPITDVHVAYKANRLYKIGYLVSSINRTHDNVADFYKFVEQNINSWDYLKVLQAYEQVKLADAFVTDVLYTLNQLVGSVSVLDVMRARPSPNSASDEEVIISKEIDPPARIDDGLNWLYYDD